MEREVFRMPTNLMIQFFSDTEECKKIQMRLVLQAAPFLKGMKESALLSVSNSMLDEMCRLLQSLSVKWFLLYGDNKKQMLLLYRQEQLKELLADPVRMLF